LIETNGVNMQMVLTRLPTVSPIPNNHNPEPSTKARVFAIGQWPDVQTPDSDVEPREGAQNGSMSEKDWLSS